MEEKQAIEQLETESNRAFEQYKASDEFASHKSFVVDPDNTDNVMRMVFMEGWARAYATALGTVREALLRKAAVD